VDQQNARGRCFTLRRRDLIALLGASFGTFPLPSAAETAVARVAILRERSLTDPQVARSWQIFVEALAQSGWIEGRNIVFDHRAIEGRTERYPELTAELVALKPTVIITINSEATEAVRARTRTIPIFMIGPGDPVRTGFIESLARPGGNITGVSSQLNDIDAKVLQMIKDLRSGATRVAFFWSPDNPAQRLGKQDFEAAAHDLGLTIDPISVATIAQLDAALTSIAATRPDALVVPPGPPFVWRADEIAAFAVEQRLLTFAFNPAMVRAGLLFSLAPRGDDIVRRAAAILAKILNGAQPADIPVEQPTKFDLLINLKTAKALDLTVPPWLLGRADEVIE